MTPQYDTSNRKKRCAPDWRHAAILTYDASYLMKLGNLSREEALALIDKYDGDRESINAELIARRRSRAAG